MVHYTTSNNKRGDTCYTEYAILPLSMAAVMECLSRYKLSAYSCHDQGHDERWDLSNYI